MENLGGVIFFAVVVIMFGVTAYLYFYGEDLDLKFWEDDSAAENVTAEGENVTEEVIVNETVVVNSTEVNETTGNETEMNETTDSEDLVNSTFPHWNHTTITYKIINKEGCWVNPIQDFEEAVSIIEDGSRGAVDFLEVQGSEYDIEVQCVDKTEFLKYVKNVSSVTCKNHTLDLYKENFDPIIEGFIEKGDYYIRHKPLTRNDTYSNFEYCFYDSSAINPGNYSWSWLFESDPVIEGDIIKSHKLSIFDEVSHSRCSHIPSRELHELFHGLGFDHVPTPPYYQGYGWSPADFYLLEDIMFEHRYCSFQKRVSEKYFDCLQKIYLDADKTCEDVVFLG